MGGSERINGITAGDSDACGMVAIIHLHIQDRKRAGMPLEVLHTPKSMAYCTERHSRHLF